MIFQGVFTVFLAISAKELVTMTRVFHKVLRGGGEFLPSWGEGGGGFFWGENFFIRWWESEEELFWPFEQSTFCKHPTSIKTKIRMTCV